MPYRRTENVARRLAARHAAIIAAAHDAASEGGMAAVQIAAVAQRAGIAAGTVYRYFPGKIDLVAALLTEISEREIGAVRAAADIAPGPLSALSAAIMTFAARALRHRRLAYAAIAEPVEAELDAARLLVWRGAASLDNADPQAVTHCAMAKRLATDAGFHVCNEALQLFGGYGYLKDFPIERYLRDVRVHQILEGTNEIMRVIIARRLLGPSNA